MASLGAAEEDQISLKWEVNRPEEHIERTQDQPQTSSSAPAVADFVSALATWNSGFSSNRLPHHVPTFDISKFIPVGCLRLHISDCVIDKEVWESCFAWAMFARGPRQQGKPYLQAAAQRALLTSSVLSPFRNLHSAEWIRMEFKSQGDYGQARVFILPDDVGRATINRESPALRRSMQQLLTRLDVSRITWSGDWSNDTPLAHIDTTLDENRVEDETSLFDLFNTLPSPQPNPEAVVDRYAQYAMTSILDSDIEGLKTVMYNYQRRSAALMLQREFQPGQNIDPRLTPCEDQRGARWYCDFNAGLCLVEPRTYESARGGICAETMGLGKTLICLALILATRDIPSKIPVEFSVDTIPVRKSTGSLKEMAAAAVGRTGTPWKSYLSDLQGGYTNEQCVDAIKKNAGHYFLPSPAPRRQSRNPIVIPPRKIWLTAATLVIVPANLVRQWVQEIKKHTTGLKYLVMDGMKKDLPPPEELSDFDIILFSKSRFEQEAKDGSDNMGRRRTTTSTVCKCPYIGDTRTRDCTCFREDDVYHSPLKSLHFKRLITDEGHTFGNSSRNTKTTAVAVVDFLQLDARWIVSGTPTQGLYGKEVATEGSNNSSTISTPLLTDHENVLLTAERCEKLSSMLEDDVTSTSSQERERLYYLQERKDLEKLGNIASVYLKARPWAPSFHTADTASWAQHVMQPRHGSKSQGNMECLRTTLESMMIRHRPEDVGCEVKLPPLYHDVVSLEGSLQDKLSLNTFSMMIVSNAVTSERKDADYLFHPRQRGPLQELVSNLRQASFFWSGYTLEDITVTIDIAKQFLEKGEIAVSLQDKTLLKQAIRIGELVLENRIKQAISTFHEMPMYVENGMPEDVRLAWALDGKPRNPTLVGATMIHEAQKLVGSQLWKEDPMEGMVAAGNLAMHAAYEAQHPPPSSRSSNTPSKDTRRASKATSDPAPALAGGVAVGDNSSLKKRSPLKPLRPISTTDLVLHSEETAFNHDSFTQPGSEGYDRDRIDKPKSALKKSAKVEIAGTLDDSSPLASASIVSTASAKLSYLMDRIITYQKDEKILVFYEADNVAYYIAQALDCLGVKHLIYAKSLSSTRRAQYVVTFNQTETFRVLLMDVSQAAFGLDMSSASRVYFINPVFSPQVEAQAIKRAHRIGQMKPVYVETLILKGSIEELILERRKLMSNEEHNKMKSILDDQAIYDWIRNVRFLPVPMDDVPGPEQMTKLETPQLVFGRGSSTILHPDADLVGGDLSPTSDRNKKGKEKAVSNSMYSHVSSAIKSPDTAVGQFLDAPSPSARSYRLHSSGRTLSTGHFQFHSQPQEVGPSKTSEDEAQAHEPRLVLGISPETLSTKRKVVTFLGQDENELSSPPARRVRFETPPMAA